ncbi:MAG: cell division protein FtsZ, partial [Candidatus Norongarragalinales archaeon]
MEEIVKSALGQPTRGASAASEEIEQIKICVVGCGGAGNNTVNRLLRLGIKGAELYAINTDRQHLATLGDPIKKVLIGKSVTKGLGAGGFPEVGAKCAEVDRAAIEQILNG